MRTAWRSRGMDGASRGAFSRDPRERPQRDAVQRFAQATQADPGPRKEDAPLAAPEAADDAFDFGCEVGLAEMVERASILGWRLSVDLGAATGRPGSLTVEQAEQGVHVLLLTQDLELFARWQSAAGALGASLSARCARPVFVRVELEGHAD